MKVNQQIFLCIITTVILILASGTSAYFWNKIDQPLSGSEYNEMWLQPINDVAVSRDDLNVVLYFGQVSEYDEETDSGYFKPHIFNNSSDSNIIIEGIKLSEYSDHTSLWDKVRDGDAWAT